MMRLAAAGATGMVELDPDVISGSQTRHWSLLGLLRLFYRVKHGTGIKNVVKRTQVPADKIYNSRNRVS